MSYNATNACIVQGSLRLTEDGLRKAEEAIGDERPVASRSRALVRRMERHLLGAVQNRPGLL